MDSVANVCGTCHGLTAEFFDKSPHKKAFATMGLAPCVTCHNNHDVAKPSDTMVGTDEKAVCVNCHDAKSAGSQKAAAIRASLDELRGALERYPLVPALKEVVAHCGGDPAWRTLRPPLVELQPGQAEAHHWAPGEVSTLRPGALMRGAFSVGRSTPKTFSSCRFLSWNTLSYGPPVVEFESLTWFTDTGE